MIDPEDQVAADIAAAEARGEDPFADKAPGEQPAATDAAPGDEPDVTQPNWRTTMTDQAIEQEIRAKGKTAPRVTPADIEANIASEYFFTGGDGICGEVANRAGSVPYCYESSLNLLTFCVLVLRNGFTVTGESACASPENFDAEIGRKVARQNAVQKIWPLMGYALKQSLHDGPARTKPKPYAWADVASYRTNERTFDGMTEFSIHMCDDHTYGGAMPSGLRWPDASAAMLAECNRQRDQAPE